MTVSLDVGIQMRLGKTHCIQKYSLLVLYVVHCSNKIYFMNVPFVDTSCIIKGVIIQTILNEELSGYCSVSLHLSLIHFLSFGRHFMIFLPTHRQEIFRGF